LSRFDDSQLLALQQKVVIEHVREHLVQIGGEPMLLCIAIQHLTLDYPSHP
jgi:hypothetical protein